MHNWTDEHYQLDTRAAFEFATTLADFVEAYTFLTRRAQFHQHPYTTICIGDDAAVKLYIAWHRERRVATRTT